MKSLVILLFFIFSANLAFSQTSITEDSVRRVILTVIKDLYKNNSVQVKEVTFDFENNPKPFFDGGDAIAVQVQWTTKEMFSNEHWMEGYVVYNSRSGRVFWFTKNASSNVNHTGKYQVGQLNSEEDLLRGMGIGKPMRKSKAQNSSN